MTVTYLDSGVLIAAAQGQPVLAEAAFAILNDSKRIFVGSVFLELELLPKPSYNSKKDELDFYTEYFNACATNVRGSAELLLAGLAEAIEHGLSGFDGCHIIAAVEANAEELITSEKLSKPIHRTHKLPTKSIQP